ncbi:DUF2806 domain-containing protein [Verrucomicrobium sp. BvORR106]|uniref:DUF2806 domain-containing protein n=1 Tax=Verrucomicrobium sp. BvORR106 TaxID=1403819 RepID=UPI00068B8E26|nr:DUF2806 domain-containing protein [Verrucomicrobium sp. BvORR106]
MQEENDQQGDTDNSISFVKLGAWAKPVNTFLQKLSGHIGDYLKPGNIVRDAKAKAQAVVIKAEADEQVKLIKLRTEARITVEQLRGQANIESIVREAISRIEETAKPEDVNDDWLANFFDKCKLISEAEMQDLWSKVLSGEVNKPGTYSKRTVNFLAELEKSDAEMFSNMLNFLLHLGHPTPLIFKEEEPIYTTNGVTFSSIQQLEAIGLIRYETFGLSKKSLPTQFRVVYHKEVLEMDLSSQRDTALPVGRVLLTQMGLQLRKLCTTRKVEGFVQYLKDGPWSKFCTPTPPPTSTPA